GAYSDDRWADPAQPRPRSLHPTNVARKRARAAACDIVAASTGALPRGGEQLVDRPQRHEPAKRRRERAVRHARLVQRQLALLDGRVRREQLLPLALEHELAVGARVLLLLDQA